MNQNFKKNIVSSIFIALIAIVLAALVVGNYFAVKYFKIISQFLDQRISKTVTNDDSDFDSQYYKSDYTSQKKLLEDQTAYAKDVQSEGAVLLQNKNLPITGKGKITLLGTDVSPALFLIGGSGSGSIDTSNMPTLKDVFEDEGFQVNPTMWNWYVSGGGKTTRTATTINEPTPGANQIASFSSYNDAAVIFFGRQGTEATDVQTYTTNDKNKSMLELAQNELDLVDLAIANFDKVVVVLNTSNAVELGTLESRNVSVLWVGAGGQQGLRAIPEIISGKRYPSGKLVDTYAYDNFSSPAMQNFGNFDFTNDNGHYVNYAENIYIGYKYYETRYADYVYGQGNAGSFDYASVVQYPFGFGLSYTEFEYSDFGMTDSGDALTLRVKVTNKGTRAGKEAVEFYMQSPYTEYDITNGIEKSAIQLVGFGKTKELAAGESETVTAKVKKEYMKAYDANGAKTWIVDAGTYYFAAGKNVHDALNNVLAAQSLTSEQRARMTAEGDSKLVATYSQKELDKTSYSIGEDGNQITNRFENDSYSHYNNSFKYLTRHDWLGTFPTTLGGEARAIEATAQMLSDMAPKTIQDDPNAVMPVTGAEKTITLASMIGLPYDHEMWKTLLNQLTAEEMMQLVANGGYGNIMIKSIEKPPVLDKDGPAGISSSLIGGVGCFGYPIEIVLASTWNIDLAEKYGYFIGEDSIISGVAGWYAPSMNVHRTPFSGRNFEYYSEDSLMSGIFAATVVKEAQAKGLYAFVKHFALNDQETNRGQVVTWANEQTIREICLTPFELSVRDGGAKAIMNSLNKVGCVWSGQHKGLMTDVLRGEWGFDGFAITDICVAYNESMNASGGIAAGTDMWLCPSAGTYNISGYASNATVMSALRESCHRILYVVANSNAMNGVSPDSIIVSVTPAWVIWLVILDVVLIGGGLTGIAFIGRSIYKRGKKEKQAN